MFLSLFAGIGGFDLGLERAGMQCVGQVEIDPFCQAVLAHHWPDVKRIDDIRKVQGDEFGTVELVCGGVPCQPASSAGKRRGTKDDRWLWPEAMRIVQEAKPTWVLFENVRGLIALDKGVVFESLLVELEGYGYEVQSFVIPACAVDAPHRRDRVWILAHSQQTGLEGLGCVAGCEEIAQPRDGGALADTPQHGRIARGPGDTEEIEERREPDRSRVDADVADPDSESAGRITESRCQCGFWDPEPDVGRVAHGIPNRVAQLCALGNAVVPQVVEKIGRAIMKAEVYK